MLTRLYFKNWRSFREENIPISTPITVFIGENSSGKSNIVDGLHFLRRMVVNGISSGGNVRDPDNPTIHLKAGQDEDLVVSFTFEPGSDGAQLTYTLTNVGKPELGPKELSRRGYVYGESLKDNEGRVWFSNNGRTMMATHRGELTPQIFVTEEQEISGLDDRLGISVFGGLAKYPEIQKTFSFIFSDRWQLLEPDFVPPLRLLPPRSGGSSWSPFMMASKAENLLAILRGLMVYRDDLYEQLQSDLRWLLNFVSRFEVEEYEALEQRLRVYEPAHMGRPAPTVSTGSKRLLAMLTAYYALDMRNAEQPGLVVIEEPDTAIHPLLLGKLVDLLRSYTERQGYPRQFILTTHNPQMLNYFEPNEVRIVERDDEGATTVKRVDEKVAEVWRQHDGVFNLGSLWTTRLIGGVPR